MSNIMENQPENVQQNNEQSIDPEHDAGRQEDRSEFLAETVTQPEVSPQNDQPEDPNNVENTGLSPEDNQKAIELREAHKNAVNDIETAGQGASENSPNTDIANFTDPSELDTAVQRNNDVIEVSKEHLDQHLPEYIETAKQEAEADGVQINSNMEDNKESDNSTSPENSIKDIDLANQLATMEDQIRPLESMIDHIQNTDFSDEKKIMLKEKLINTVESLKTKSADLEREYTDSYRKELDYILERVVNAVTDNEVFKDVGIIELTGNNTLTYAQNVSLTKELARATGAEIDESIFDRSVKPKIALDEELASGKQKQDQPYVYEIPDKFGNYLTFYFEVDESGNKYNLVTDYKSGKDNHDTDINPVHFD